MDSRTGFSVVLVLLGIGGMALLFTGKFKNVLVALQQPGDTGWQNDAGQAAPEAAAGGSWAGSAQSSGSSTSAGGGAQTPPARPVSYTPTFSINQNPYSVALAGTDGLAVAPFGVGASA